MAWNRKKTITVLIVVLLLSFLFMIINIGLVLFYLLKQSKIEYSRSFIYLLASTYGTGLGCIWFRINQAKRTYTHGILHTVVLVLMLIGHREIFKLLKDGEIAACCNKYALSMFTICMYLIQYILSFHLMIFRDGRNPSERAFRSGLHAFGGALISFVCIVDGLLAWNKMMIQYRIHFNQNLHFHLSMMCILFYGVCTWYLILNPYFDWRRLKALSLSRISKTSLRRTPSKTILRSSSTSSVRPSRSLNRPPNRPSNISSSRSLSQPGTRRFL